MVERRQQVVNGGMASKTFIHGGTARIDWECRPTPQLRMAPAVQDGSSDAGVSAQSDLHAPITHAVRSPCTHSPAFVLGAHTLNMSSSSHSPSS
eukprot:493421-Pelagomonas_calceolata.AAC.1